MAESESASSTLGARFGSARMMNTTMDMMKDAMSTTQMKGADMAMMQECIEALSACEQACVMCADADAGEGMARCAGMCANCADLSGTMMRMMLRMNGWDMAVMMSAMETTMAMCRACSAECMMHAEMSEHCRMCAMACDQAAMALEKMLGSMREMMPGM
ncbi:hypothetical protein [Agromyces aerolatus]|uniref:hypothetical protein n=1 Tax=Agromyces sp. LY-1074 TaxID=3074080 RepID=UPI0028650DA2|nr:MULTISPECIES: hypothetical protein [unclassified Agromyces]MDR5700305.1 hypothetical protein [Agromyces sp. LY-1074]MDR5706717.1 hypothetical protein [Agromyces sp. LY-1358]